MAQSVALGKHEERPPRPGGKVGSGESQEGWIVLEEV